MSSNPSLTINRYFRLMSLATIELLVNTPISVYGIYLNLKSGTIQPWKGWADTHFQYSLVVQYPSALWRSDYPVVVSLELSRWSIIFCAFVFFVFFGFAEEARRHYRLVYWAVARRFGILPPPKAFSG
jgi:pheromone a factor receptor